MYGNIVVEHVDFYGSIHMHCVATTDNGDRCNMPHKLSSLQRSSPCIHVRQSRMPYAM